MICCLDHVNQLQGGINELSVKTIYFHFYKLPDEVKNSKFHTGYSI